MNQILVTEKSSKKINKNKNKNKNNNNKIEIVPIIRFFAVSIMMFGIVMLGQGSYAIYRNAEDRKPSNIPYVTVGRINDRAIIYVEHNVEISKITYSWNNGEENVIPVGTTNTKEEILLSGYDSVLNLTIEDINGKQVTFKKQYYLNNEDITKPSIEIYAEDGNDKMIITAKDETAMGYVSYKWGDEETVVIKASQEGQRQIQQEVTLTPGTKTIKVIAEDKNGNIEQIEKEVVISTSKPVMTIYRGKNDFTLNVVDKDGVKDITINLNGQIFEKKNINLKNVTVGVLKLREGNNTVAIEVTNVSGYTQKVTTELQYIP
ncbi:MAG: hypothetical protein ACI4UU_01470 [Clostridia bacterium]